MNTATSTATGLEGPGVYLLFLAGVAIICIALTVAAIQQARADRRRPYAGRPHGLDAPTDDRRSA